MLKRNGKAIAARMAASEGEPEIVFPLLKIEREDPPLPFNSEHANLPLPSNSDQENHYYPSVKSEKENFENFGRQVQEMKSQVTGVFTDWEGFESLMRANNMRYCAPTLK